MLRDVDEREHLAELAANVRYTIHAERVKANKLFDKKKEIQRVEQQLKNPQKKQKTDNTELAKKIRAMNEHFSKKGSE